jgi:hypothetical protein
MTLVSGCRAMRGERQRRGAAHLTGDLNGDAASEPEGILLPLLRGPWETRAILSRGRGVIAARMRLSSMSGFEDWQPKNCLFTLGG